MTAAHPLLIEIDTRTKNALTNGQATGTVGHQSGQELGAFHLTWSWNGSTLDVTSYPHGFFPAFYYCDAHRFILSDNLQTIASRLEMLEIDHEALAAFLYSGLWLGDRTPFHGIRAMPEGGKFSWSATHGLKITERVAETPTSDLCRRQMIDGFIDLFRQAVTRLASSPISLPLSGGRDSRHILLELIRQGKRVERAVTVDFFPPRGSNDIDIASQVAEHFSLAHEIARQRAPALQCEEEKNLLNNFSFLEGGWKPLLSQQFEGRSEQIFDGIGGDVLIAGLFLDESELDLLETRQLHTLAGKLCSRNYEALKPLLQTDLPEYQFAHAQQFIESHLGQYTRDHNLLSSFYLWNRTRRQIAGQTVGLFGGGNVAAPFLDPDLFNFARSIPLAELVGKRFHDEVLETAYPGLMDVPLARSWQIAIPWSHRRQVVFGLASRLASYRGGGINKRRVLRRMASALVGNEPWRLQQCAPDALTYLMQLHRCFGAASD